MVLAPARFSERIVLTPSNGDLPNISNGTLPPRDGYNGFDPNRYEPGVIIPLEVWRPKIPLPQAILFDVDSTLFESEALHDFGHHQLISRLYLGLPQGQTWSRECWNKWLVSDKPEYPLVPEHPEMLPNPIHYVRALTEGSCFFRAETEVIQRIHQRLAFLSKVEGTGVPREVVSRFLEPEQYKKLKTEIMIDAMTGNGPRHQLKLIEGAHELFTLVLEHNIPFALGTGSPRKIIEAMFSYAGWLPHVRHAVTADDLYCPIEKRFRPGKPDPLTFNLGYDHLRAAYPEVKSRNRVYVFEDQAKGAHAARRGGFTALLCPDPTNGKDVRAHVEELRKLERESPCPGQPPVIVAQNHHLGWRPFLEKIFVKEGALDYRRRVT